MLCTTMRIKRVREYFANAFEGHTSAVRMGQMFSEPAALFSMMSYGLKPPKYEIPVSLEHCNLSGPCNFFLKEFIGKIRAAPETGFLSRYEFLCSTSPLLVNLWSWSAKVVFRDFRDFFYFWTNFPYKSLRNFHLRKLQGPDRLELLDLSETSDLVSIGG